MKYAHCKGIALFLPIYLFLPLLSITQAQETDRSAIDKNRGAVYYLSEQDELLMRVNVWGFVQKPGQYMVPKDTDLISLISFAGGPREEAKIKKIKLIRSDKKTTSPADADSKDGNGKRVFEVDVKRYLKTGNQDLIPDLQPGDTIVVEGSTFHFVTKALEFTAKLAVFVNVYYLIQISSNQK